MGLRERGVGLVIGMLLVAGSAIGGSSDADPRTVAADGATQPSPGGLLARSDRLDCPGRHRTVFLLDRGEPAPGVTMRDALASRPGAVVEETTADRAVAVLAVDGEVVEVLVVRRWPSTGGWAVDSGARCADGPSGS